MMVVSKAPLKALESLPLEFYLEELKGRHSFSLVASAPIHLIGRDILEVYEAHFFSLIKGEFFIPEGLIRLPSHIMFVTHDESDAEQVTTLST